MDFDVTASAPGKILWLGGYAAIEKESTSLVSAVNAYVSAHVVKRNDNTVEINSPDLKMSAKGTMNPETGIIEMQVPKELALVRTSIEITTRYLSGKGEWLSGFTLETKNDPQFSYTLDSGKVSKSGLGSSAAVTVASIKAVSKLFLGKDLDQQVLHKLAQLAHSMATGKIGSGFDLASAVYGTILYKRCDPLFLKTLDEQYKTWQLVELVDKDWDFYIEKFSMPDNFSLLFANFIGEAMITTTALGSVSEFKKKDPERYYELINGIDNTSVLAIESLKKIKNGQDALADFKDAFDMGRLLTKKLGELSNVRIEPDDCTALIDESKNNGAFVAKLPGAGGKDAIAAITLNAQDREKLANFWKSRKEIGILDIKMI